MPSPETAAFQELTAIGVRDHGGAPPNLIADELRTCHRRTAGVYRVLSDYEALIAAGKYRPALAAYEAALVEIENAKPQPITVAPVSLRRALLAAVLRHEPANAPTGLAVRLGGLRGALSELQRRTWDGNVGPRDRLLIAVLTNSVDTDDVATIVGPLPPIRALSMTGYTGYPAWAKAISNAVGVTGEMPDDQKRRRTIEALDALLPALGQNRNWLGLYWTLEARAQLADANLVDCLPASTFASEAFIELVGRHLARAEDDHANTSAGDVANAAKPVSKPTTPARTPPVGR